MCCSLALFSSDIDVFFSFKCATRNSKNMIFCRSILSNYFDFFYYLFISNCFFFANKIFSFLLQVITTNFPTNFLSGENKNYAELEMLPQIPRCKMMAHIFPHFVFCTSLNYDGDEIRNWLTQTNIPFGMFRTGNGRSGECK